MQPDSNQPARLYGTTKTHKFETLEDITVANLKFRPIIDQTTIITSNAAKVILDYFQSAFTSSRLTIDTLEQGVKYVQS